MIPPRKISSCARLPLACDAANLSITVETVNMITKPSLIQCHIFVRSGLLDDGPLTIAYGAARQSVEDVACCGSVAVDMDYSIRLLQMLG